MTFSSGVGGMSSAGNPPSYAKFFLGRKLPQPQARGEPAVLLRCRNPTQPCSLCELFGRYAVNVLPLPKQNKGAPRTQWYVEFPEPLPAPPRTSNKHPRQAGRSRYLPPKANGVHESSRWVRPSSEEIQGETTCFGRAARVGRSLPRPKHRFFVQLPRCTALLPHKCSFPARLHQPLLPTYPLGFAKGRQWLRRPRPGGVGVRSCVLGDPSLRQPEQLLTCSLIDGTVVLVAYKSFAPARAQRWFTFP